MWRYDDSLLFVKFSSPVHNDIAKVLSFVVRFLPDWILERDSRFECFRKMPGRKMSSIKSITFDLAKKKFVGIFFPFLAVD